MPGSGKISWKVKHRTGPYHEKLSILDKIQVHVYMFLHDKTECILLESVNTDGMVFTKQRTIEQDKEFWSLVQERLSTLLQFTDHLGGRLYVHAPLLHRNSSRTSPNSCGMCLTTRRGHWLRLYVNHEIDGIAFIRNHV